MKPRQFSLFPKARPEFGGSLLIGKRKSKRPLSIKLPIHLIIKSEKAKGKLSFVAYQTKILALIQSTAAKYNIRIYEKAVNFNHVHLVLKLSDLKSYTPWIREITAKIAMYLQTKTTQHLGQFFSLRPFSRIMNWGKDFKGVMNYQILNQLEIFGMRPSKKPTAKAKKKARPPA